MSNKPTLMGPIVWVICLASAGALVFTDLIDVRGILQSVVLSILWVIFAVGAFVFEAIITGLNSMMDAIPDNIIGGLLVAVLVFILAMIALVLLLIFGVIWLLLYGFFWSIGWVLGSIGILEQIIYTGMLAVALRLFVVRALFWVLRPAAPVMAVAIHDLFYAVPRDAVDQLAATGETSIRVRGILELGIALAAIAIAIAAHMLRTR